MWSGSADQLMLESHLHLPEQRRGGQDRKNRGISTPNRLLLKTFWMQRALAALKRRTRKEPAGGTCRQANYELLHTKETRNEAPRSGIKTNVFSTDGRLSRSRGQILILVVYFFLNPRWGKMLRQKHWPVVCFG